MTDFDLSEDMAKKRSQVEKAKGKLNAIRKRNQRKRQSVSKTEGLIEHARSKIAEHQKIIDYHLESIKGWEKKLEIVPEFEDETSAKEKFDRVSREYEEMEVLLWDIEDLQKKAEKEDADYLREAIEDRAKHLKTKFKSTKGHGF